MFGDAQIILQQQMDQHHAELTTWVCAVRQARTAFDAARIASRMPCQPPLLRALAELDDEETRARCLVEAELQVRMSLAALTDPNMQPILRALQGHWPAVYSALHKRVMNSSARRRI